ncbi:MAG: T9SS type A sorting domain-containing protein, partial [Bacteroidales bacterium]|nr:T9SS type A sorting domain-containing protein [Bacteroidales bacterium]
TIAIYPNPVSDYIYIELSDNSICTAIEIYSLDGRLVKSQINNLSTIDLSSLPMGVYIVKIRMADGKEFAERIIKE